MSFPDCEILQIPRKGDVISRFIILYRFSIDTGSLRRDFENVALKPFYCFVAHP